MPLRRGTGSWGDRSSAERRVKTARRRASPVRFLLAQVNFGCRLTSGRSIARDARRRMTSQYRAELIRLTDSRWRDPATGTLRGRDPANDTDAWGRRSCRETRTSTTSSWATELSTQESRTTLPAGRNNIGGHQASMDISSRSAGARLVLRRWIGSADSVSARSRLRGTRSR